MNEIQSGILSSVLYADVFDSAILVSDLYLKLHLKSKISHREFKHELKTLIKKNVLFENDGVVSLEDKKNNIKKLNKHSFIYDQKISQVKKLLKNAFFCPFILGIFVTGSLAANNSATDDDIDIMIISKNNRLWIVRLWVILCSEFLGIRKRPNDKNVKDKLCFNMFLEECTLEINKNQRNMYVANEIQQVKQVYIRNDCDKKFLLKNRWILQFLPNAFYNLDFEFWEDNKFFNRNNNERKSDSFFSLINRCAYYIQSFYMNSKKTTEVVEYSMALFHPRPTKNMVLQAFETRKKRFGLV